jgi:hypothetical protein
MKRSQDVDFDALFDSLNTGSPTAGDEGQATSSDVDDAWDDEDDKD